MIPEQNGDPVVESEEARGGGRGPGDSEEISRELNPHTPAS